MAQAVAGFSPRGPGSYFCIIWGMNNRPVGGCSSETQPHPINMNNNNITSGNTTRRFNTIWARNLSPPMDKNHLTVPSNFYIYSLFTYDPSQQ
jgi:hypothetical protein